MNKYIFPTVITIIVLLVIIIAIVFAIKHLSKEGFGSTASAGELTSNNKKYSSIVDPVPLDSTTQDFKDGNNFLTTDETGNIDTFPGGTIFAKLDRLTKMTDTNKERADFIADVVSKMPNNPEEIDNLKTQIATLTAELNAIKTKYVDKTKDIKITRSSGTAPLTNYTMFADYAGPNTTLAVFVNDTANAAVNKLRILQ